MSSSSAHAAPAIRPLLLAVASGWLVFAGMNALAGPRWRSVASEIAAAIVTLLLRELVRRRPEVRSACIHAASAVNTGALVVLTWLGGGPEGLGVWYLPAVPLFVAHLEGRRAGWIWCGIAAAACLLGRLVDPGIVEFVPEPAHRVVAGVWLVVICTAFAAMSRREVDARMDELERAARARAELTAAISHDIRTPLSGMLGITTVLGETELDGEQQQLVATLRSSGKTLSRIVDDVLDAAQLESGRFRITTAPVDLRDVLGDIADLHGPDAGSKGLTLTLRMTGGDAFRVIADDVRVRQIVSNLVGNAVKFTREGGVTLRASARREGPRTALELRVEDTGPGIPADQADKLFGRFERLDTESSRRAAGTGLGLAISRDLAQLMGGSLELERDRAAGACFVVRVSFGAQEPLGDADGSAETVRVIGPRAARGDLTPSRVATDAVSVPTSRRASSRPAAERGVALVIDDDPTNRRILQEIVAHRGFRVIAEPGAESALPRLRLERFDVIFCDLQMPGMDGLAFISAARAEGHPGRFVATTASVRDDDPERCRTAGFDAFVRKPFHIGELDALLATVGTRRAPTALIDEVAWEAGRALMGAEHEDLVREHLETARRHVATIRDHADDAERVARAAHTLASGSLMLGLAALGDGARTIETGAAAMSAEKRRESGERLASVLDATAAAVRPRA